MTTDSPKGPESEARPEESLTERLAQIISFQWGFDESNFGATNADRLAAAVARVVVEPELERLTAEVERLQASRDVNYGDAGTFASLYRTEQARANELETRLDKTEDTYSELLRGMAERASDFRRALKFADAHVPQWERIIAEHKAEVSRLREQLAATSKALADSVEGMEDMVGYVGPYFREKWDHDGYIARAKTALAGLGVSSSEVEAPQPTQHAVTVEPHGTDWWAAKCPACDVVQYSKTQQVAEDWRDQHEADTLVPQLVEDPALARHRAVLRGAPMSVLHDPDWVDEGRPPGSERLAPRPVGTMALVREFHEAFGLPINDTSKTLNKLRADLIREEAREAATALEVGPPEAWAKELADLVIVAFGAALTLGIDLDHAVQLVHESNMSKLGPDGRPVMRPDGKVLKGPNYVPPDMSSALLQDAAQAARSEATPEALASHGNSMADQLVQLAQLFRSPVSTQEETKEGETDG